MNCRLATGRAIRSRPLKASTVVNRPAIQAAMQELVSLVREHCGGEISWSVVDRDHPWAVLG